MNSMLEITPELIKEVVEELHNGETPEQRVKRAKFSAKLYPIEKKIRQMILCEGEPVTLKEYRDAYIKAYEETYGDLYEEVYGEDE